MGIRYPHTARGAAGVGRVVRRPTPTDAWQNGATHGEYGLPHQCAHRFAMTGFFEGAAQGGGRIATSLRSSQ